MKLNASGQLEFCEAKRTGSPFSPNRKWQQVVVFSKTRAWPLWHFEQFLYQLLIWCLFTAHQKIPNRWNIQGKVSTKSPHGCAKFCSKTQTIHIWKIRYVHFKCILHKIIERTQVSYRFKYLINIYLVLSTPPSPCKVHTSSIYPLIYIPTLPIYILWTLEKEQASYTKTRGPFH